MASWAAPLIQVTNLGKTRRPGLLRQVSPTVDPSSMIDGIRRNYDSRCYRCACKNDTASSVPESDAWVGMAQAVWLSLRWSWVMTR